jgi:hypothetical protein
MEAPQVVATITARFAFNTTTQPRIKPSMVTNYTYVVII